MLLSRTDGWVLVTPEMARSLLATNTNNRAVRHGNVRLYARRMRNGEWISNKTEPITFDRNGRLIQGQHRLLAVIESGVPIRFWLAFDESPEAWDVLDQPGRRNLADMLTLEKKIAEVVQLACVLSSGQTRVETPLAKKVAPVVAPVAAELVRVHGTVCRFFSSAPMRLAAVVHAMRGDRDHAWSVYGHLIHGRVEDMPPVAKALVSQVVRGTIRYGGGAGASDGVYARGFKVLDPSHANDTKLLVTHDDPTKSRAALCEALAIAP